MKLTSQIHNSMAGRPPIEQSFVNRWLAAESEPPEDLVPHLENRIGARAYLNTKAFQEWAAVAANGSDPSEVVGFTPATPEDYEAMRAEVRSNNKLGDLLASNYQCVATPRANSFAPTADEQQIGKLMGLSGSDIVTAKVLEFMRDTPAVVPSGLNDSEATIAQLIGVPADELARFKATMTLQPDGSYQLPTR